MSEKYETSLWSSKEKAHLVSEETIAVLFLGFVCIYGQKWTEEV